MDLGQFLAHPNTGRYVTERIQERLNPADRGYMGAEYFPEIFRNVTEYKRRVVRLGPALIAADVAPLSTGRFGGRLSRQEVGGGLIDSAAHFHYHGKDIEDLQFLWSEIEALPGTTVTPGMSALESYFNVVENKLLEPLDMNRERKRWTLLGTGRAWHDGSRDDDFTRPSVLNVYDASQTLVRAVGAATNIYTAGSTANFFDDVQNRVDAARSAGYEIQEIVMHGTTRQQILGLESTKTAVGGMALQVATGGQMQVQMTQGNATVEAFNSALAQRDLPPVRIYSGNWADQVREPGDPAGDVGTVVVTPYIPKGRVILIPRLNPGDDGLINPDVPQRSLTPEAAARRIGVHVIGRPTAQSDGAKIYVFGPNYHPGVNPSFDGDSIMAHMPFLNVPAGIQVIEYAR